MKAKFFIYDDKVKLRQATKQGYIECPLDGVADLSFPTSTKRRGRVQGDGGICPTIATTGGLYRIERINKMEKDELKKHFAIRKLTPEECFILQGMTKEDVDKCRNVGVSDSQLYKQSGNGLTSNCVQFLMEHLMKAYKPDYVTTDEKMAAKYGEIK